MKLRISLAFLLLSVNSALADLPQMSGEKEWLGYFVGWVGRDADFGITADGEGVLMPRKDRERIGHKEIDIRYLVEEKMEDGRWVRRRFLEDGGLASENDKGIDPEKPVVVVTTVTGGTKVSWTHRVDDGEVSIQPKLLEKATDNEIRIGVEFALPRLYRFDSSDDEDQIADKVEDDSLTARRLKDGKRVKVDFDEFEEDLTSADYLAEGASEVEVETKALRGATLVIENGEEKTGRIDIQQKGPLYNSFRLTWMADPAKLGQEGCFVTASVE